MDEKRPSAERFEEEEESVRLLLERAGPRPPLSQGDLDSIRSALSSAWQFEVRRRARAVPRRPVWPLAAALAAALALAAGLAWWWVSRASHVGGTPPTVAWVEEVKGHVRLVEPVSRRPKLVEGDPIPLGAVLESGGGDEEGKASLRLPHGANVRLRAGTRLRLASASSLELERGGLYVDTESGPGWPRSDQTIEVRTAVGTARDIGTQFSVRLVDSGSQAMVVRVREGAILTEQQGRTYLTRAGQELVLSGDGTSESRAAAGSGPEWSWLLEVTPGFEIEGRRLGDFLAWVGRETGWRIVLEEGVESGASEIVLHGSIGELRPDQAPFAVLPGAGLEGKLEGETLVIRRRR